VEATRDKDNAEIPFYGFYHGVSSEAPAKSIMENGLDPAFTELKYGSRKSFLRPINNHVYLTPDIGYALIYALSGVVMGTNYYESEYGLKDIKKNGQFGFVFEFPGDSLTDYLPDEDCVGRIAAHILTGDGTKQTRYDWSKVTPIEEVLKGYIRKYLTANTQQKLRSGEFIWGAKAGKKLISVLPKNILETILEAGSSVAHNGGLKPSGCWKIDKTKAFLLAPDGSNFFEVAERLS